MPTPENPEKTINFPTPVDAVLGGAAILVSNVGEYLVTNPTAKLLIFIGSVAAAAPVMYRAIKSDSQPEMPPVEYMDSSGQL
jgi:energy-converting hydrogenase Eha subunit A